MPSDAKTATREAILNLTLESAVGADGAASVYVFADDVLVSCAPLTGDEARVRLPLVMNASVRVLVGPAPWPGQPPPRLEALLRLRAFEPGFNFRENQDRYSAAPVPALTWRYWQWCQCPVRGVVLTGPSGDAPPVPGARIAVRRIEPFFAFFGGLADDDVLRLRDEFLSTPEGAAAKNQDGLRSASIVRIRSALAEAASALRQHWRSTPHWWRARCSDIASIVADSGGCFELTFWHLAEDDNDLLFVVVEPEKGESTVWDYVCGDVVTVRIPLDVP